MTRLYISFIRNVFLIRAPLPISMPATGTIVCGRGLVYPTTLLNVELLYKH